MQWTGGPGAGFTTGAPWLPVHPGAGTVNAERQQADKGSMLAWYTGLLQLRRTDPALRSGAYVPLDSGNPKVLAYGRRSKSGAGLLVLLNMSNERQTLKITGWPGKAPHVRAVVMASAPADPANLVDPVLGPFAAQLVRFSSASPKR